MALTIRERTTNLYQFLLRLAGVVGELYTVRADYQGEYGQWRLSACAFSIALRERYIKLLVRRRTTHLHCPRPVPTSRKGGTILYFQGRLVIEGVKCHVYRSPLNEQTPLPLPLKTMSKLFSDRAYVEPTPLPPSVPHVDELGVTSAPLRSASFFIGAHCKEINGASPPDMANGRGLYALQAGEW
jgi:hypothetical protein